MSPIILKTSPFPQALYRQPAKAVVILTRAHSKLTE